MMLIPNNPLLIIHLDLNFVLAWLTTSREISTAIEQPLTTYTILNTVCLLSRGLLGIFLRFLKRSTCICSQNF